MFKSGRTFLCFLWVSIALLSTSTWLSGQVAVTTQHNDTSRTGANLGETVLNTSNVNVNTFGKLFSLKVDGMIYAQPLYVPGLDIPESGLHNVVFVATQHDSVYAFDADSYGPPLWAVNLGPSLPTWVVNGDSNITFEVGITSTPVIDLSSQTIYVVAETYEEGAAIFRLHAMDLTTGSEKFGGPVVIEGSVPASSSDSNEGVLTFDPVMHFQRPGLLEWNNHIYVAFGSHHDDLPYHGWIFDYDAGTLQQAAVRCLTPDGFGAGVWQGGVGLTVDANGDIYIQTGHAEQITEGVNYGASVVKLSGQNNLEILDYFTPMNRDELNSNDIDFGSSGPILIPGTSLAVGGGKDGKLFLFDTNNLGQFTPDANNVVQWWQATWGVMEDGGLFAGHLFYDSKLYLWGRRDNLKAYSFRGSTFDENPVSQSSFTVPDGFSNEPAMSLSADGTIPGTGIVWAAYSATGEGADGYAHPGILRAFDASDLTNELWNSDQYPSRDSSGTWAKWTPPTIANGKVYLGTFGTSYGGTSDLNVFGLNPPEIGGGILVGRGDSSPAPVDLTAEGTSDWIHWGTEGSDRKAGVAPQLSDDTLATSTHIEIYGDDPRPISWSDGTSSEAGSYNTAGHYVSEPEKGFALSAPADENIRVLTLHVGGWNSSGTLKASLSDVSAEEFLDVTPLDSYQYDRNYTIEYRASRPGQRLQISWTLTSGEGNVTLSGVALSGSVGSGETGDGPIGGTGDPADEPMDDPTDGGTNGGTDDGTGGGPTGRIVPTAGTPQSAEVSMGFGTALQVTVTDRDSNPASGVTVTFTAPDSGASASFGGNLTAEAVTDDGGIATAPELTANSVAGDYTVTADAPGVAAPARFMLRNTLPPDTPGSMGSLSGSVNDSGAAADLEAEGTSDWIHWGDFSRKAGVDPQLSTFEVVGDGPVYQYDDDVRPLNWAGGTPLETGSNNTSGVYIHSSGNGFSFTATADDTPRILTIHVGGWASGGTLSASLSDGSAAAFTDTTSTEEGRLTRNYTLTYRAAGPGQTLTVSWTMSSGDSDGNVTVAGAALSPAP